MGGSLDGYNSYAQRGNLPAIEIENVFEGAMALWPVRGRLRVVRHWGGMTMDGSPIIDRSPACLST